MTAGAPTSRRVVAGVRRFLTWMLLVLATFGCGHTPPAAPPTPAAVALPKPPQASVPSAYKPPVTPLKGADLLADPASGAVEGVPFLMKSAIFWRDPDAAWISFNDRVPTTKGAFDPRARVRLARSFKLYVAPVPLVPGTYAARDGAIPADSPIRGAALQLADGRIVTSGWSAVLRVDQVVRREAIVDGTPTAPNVLGAVAITFKKPGAWINGIFLAHDTLRDSEVAPGAPTVPSY